jgi:FkbM family methyltransferase
MTASILGVVVETNQGVFCVSTQDRGVGASLRETANYGERELALLKTLTNSDSSVLMVGAHVGALVVPLSRHVLSIDALEANPLTFRLLEMNLRLNDCGNVLAHQVAASDSDQPIEFVLNVDNSGGSKRMPIVRDPRYFSDDPAVVRVNAARLDELFAGRFFDLIFMDIEGSEYFAMQGMPRLLEAASAVITEFVPHHLRNVAGIGVKEFHAPLASFQTLVVPGLRVSVHGPDIHTMLERMMEYEHEDEAIAFIKERIDAPFPDAGSMLGQIPPAA